MDKIINAEVREAIDDTGLNVWHIECRFENGDKHAPIEVDGDMPELAARIAALIVAGSADARQLAEANAEIERLRQEHITIGHTLSMMTCAATDGRNSVRLAEIANAQWREQVQEIERLRGLLERIAGMEYIDFPTHDEILEVLGKGPADADQ